MTPISGYRRHSARRGLALLITLMVVGLLSASVISFIRHSHLEARVVENTHSFTQAEILAQSGLKGAMALLASDDRDYDALTDEWADFPRYAAMGSSLFDEGSFTGRIEDLSGRFNPNKLITTAGLVDDYRAAQFLRLMAETGADESAIDAVLDWLDKDTTPRPTGAEKDYYQSLENPYPPADGPFLSIGQLSLVRGLDRKVLEGDGEKPGLDAYLTVYGEGRINLNTAGETVLMSLDDGLTQDLAREIMNVRASDPFTRLDDLRDVPGMTPEVLARIISRSSVKSEWFKITVEGTFREARAVITGIVQRTSAGVRLVYYRAG